MDIEILEELRGKGDHTPALILSALGQVDDRVAGLRAGGDDYLPKPYAFSELLARVEALARRRKPDAAEADYPLLYSAVRSAALDMIRTDARRSRPPGLASTDAH